MTDQNKRNFYFFNGFGQINERPGLFVSVLGAAAKLVFGIFRRRAKRREIGSADTDQAGPVVEQPGLVFAGHVDAPDRDDLHGKGCLKSLSMLRGPRLDRGLLMVNILADFKAKCKWRTALAVL